jgi:hypothetical protein
MGKFFNFKVLTMTNEVVKEEFSFTFNILESSKLQRLYVSRDLTKLMEVLDDSKCRIWGFRTGTITGKEVKMKLLF